MLETHSHTNIHEHNMNDTHEHEHRHADEHVHTDLDEIGCACCENHSHSDELPVSRSLRIRLILAAVFYILSMVLESGYGRVSAVCCLAALIVCGYDVFYTAAVRLIESFSIDEYLLMTIVSFAAIAIGEFEEGAISMLLFRIGECVQRYALRASRRKAGTAIGHSESAHHSISGSRYSFLTRFSRIYTPAVLIAALAVALAAPLLFDLSFSDSIYRALSFLVLACPCAIVISLPMVYSFAIGAAAGRKVYFLDTEAVDRMAREESPAEEMQNGLYSCLGGAVLLQNESDVRIAVTFARRAHRIADENIIFVITIKLIVLLLSAFGVSSLWFSVFADSGVTVLAILNSLRALRG